MKQTWVGLIVAALAGFRHAHSISEVRSPNRIIETTKADAAWGSWAEVLPDLNCDGVGDLAVSDGFYRRSIQVGRYLEQPIILYSGSRGQELGRISDLAFCHGTAAITGVVDANGSCDTLVIGGLIAGSESTSITLSLTIVDVATLSIRKRIDSVPFSPPGDEMWGRARLVCFQGEGRPYVALFFAMLTKESAHNLGAIVSLDADPTVRLLDAWTGPHNWRFTGLLSVPDSDNDGFDDLLLGVVSPETAARREGGHESGRVVLLSGRDASVLRSYESPGGSECFSGYHERAMAILPGWKNQPARLVVGQPNFSSLSAKGSGANTGSYVYVFDLNSGALLQAISRQGYFGEGLAAVFHEGEEVLVVGDEAGMGGVFGIALGSHNSRWAIMGKDGPGLGLFGDFNFGRRIIGPIPGSPGWIVVNSRDNWNDGGRILIVDALHGTEVYELERE